MLGRLDGQCVLDSTGFGRRGGGRNTAETLQSRPGPSVESTKDGASPVHVANIRGGALETNSERGAVIADEVEPIAGRHGFAHSCSGDGVLWKPPKRRGESREQPIAHEGERQGEQDAASQLQTFAPHRLGCSRRFRQSSHRQQHAEGGQQAEGEGDGSLVLQESGERREQGIGDHALGVVELA